MICWYFLDDSIPKTISRNIANNGEIAVTVRRCVAQNRFSRPIAPFPSFRKRALWPLSQPSFASHSTSFANQITMGPISSAGVDEEESDPLEPVLFDSEPFQEEWRERAYISRFHVYATISMPMFGVHIVLWSCIHTLPSPEARSTIHV